MPVIATDTPRISSVVKMEFEPGKAQCRDKVVINNPTAGTLVVGTVLGKILAGGAATAAATAGNTGNGTVGAITVTSLASLGAYRVVFNAPTTFVVYTPEGGLVGNGTTGTAFNQRGLSFTITAGGTAFVSGDSFTLTVTGAYKYKVQNDTATDGSQVAVAILIGVDEITAAVTVAANTDATAIAWTRGPLQYSQYNLVFGNTGATTAQKQVVYDALAAKGMLNDVTV